MRSPAYDLSAVLPEGVTERPAPALREQLMDFHQSRARRRRRRRSRLQVLCAAVWIASVVPLGAASLTCTTPVELALAVPAWLGLGLFVSSAPPIDDRRAPSPSDPVAYWTVFARAHKTTDLPARALVYEVALRSGVLSWLEGRTTPAQREVAFALAPEFDGTIGELLDAARHLEAENTHGSGTPRATRADGPLAGPM